MVGTVLVSLPISHAGGALVVKHNNTTECFNFADQSGVRGIVQWAAFYSDCVHEVKAVTLGFRVTIAYSIVVRKGHSVPAAKSGWCVADKLTHTAWPSTITPCLESVVSCLRQLRDEENQSAVGIYLSHMYTHEALNAAGLKGADRVLYTHLSKRWEVTLMNVLQKVHEIGPNDHDDYDDDGGGNDDHSYTNTVFAFTAKDIDALARGAKCSAPVGLSDVPFVTPWDTREVLKETTNRTAGSNQGNWYESGTNEIDSLYLHAALIIRLDTEEEEEEEEEEEVEEEEEEEDDNV